MPSCGRQSTFPLSGVAAFDSTRDRKRGRVNFRGASEDGCAPQFQPHRDGPAPAGLRPTRPDRSASIPPPIPVNPLYRIPIPPGRQQKKQAEPELEDNRCQCGDHTERHAEHSDRTGLHAPQGKSDEKGPLRFGSGQIVHSSQPTHHSTHRRPRLTNRQSQE